jgi:imidazole glycerol phosphate synthase glutamine amidotransferase subunit
VKVAVVATGVANLASVLAGLKRAGAEPTVTEDAAVVRDAASAFLPGVGAFGAGMEGLRRTGCGDAVAERARKGRPLMAICLGLQMLTDDSEETPGVAGLGVVPGHVTRFRGDVRIPHFGWNHVSPTPGARLLQPGYAYFANSYKLDAVPAGWEGATSEHGGTFVAAIERGPVVACQFHPELSGDWGQDLLKRWLTASKGASC